MTTTTLASSRLEELGDTGVDVVTGAFSYSGGAIAAELARRGRRVRTMTGHPQRAGGAPGLEVRPLDFDDLPGMVASLEGATTLYNTYWVRFAHGHSDHQRAVDNSRALFYAARRAGVQRIVHVSITNPSIASPFPYFRGKALVERSLAETGVSYAVLRPAILFGGEAGEVVDVDPADAVGTTTAHGEDGDVAEEPSDVVDQDAVAAEEDGRADDGVGEIALGERPLHQGLAPEVGKGRVAAGVGDAHVHDPLDTRPLRGMEQRP